MKLNAVYHLIIQGRRNRGGGGGAGGPSPPIFQKCPFSGGKMPSVFVKNVVLIAFLEWPLINANIFGKIFLDALYDCIYFFPSPRAVAREGIGGGGWLTTQLF